ncbi:hypothetical protein ACFFRR_010487 [Megaselia abdita]
MEDFDFENIANSINLELKETALAQTNGNYDFELESMLFTKPLKQFMSDFNLKNKEENRITETRFQQAIALTKSFERKSNSESDECRNTGNEQFKMRRFMEALHCYFDAFALAESNDRKAKCLANLSVIFFNLERFECCLKAIHQFNEVYQEPDALSLKISKRHTECLAAMAKKAQPNTNELSLRYPENPSNHEVVDCIEHSGSGVFAKRYMGTGDVIAITEPFIRFEKSGLKVESCKNCFKNLIETGIAMTCEKCVNTLYCSRECQENDQEFHNFICKSVNSIFTFLCPSEIFALKFAHQVLSEGIDIREEAFSNSQTNVLNWTGRNFENSVKAFTSLKIPGGIKNIKTFISKWSIITKHLKQHSSLEYLLSKFENGEEVFFQAYFKILKFCRLPITLESEFENIAHSINYDLLYGLFKHSCAPNVLLYRSPNSGKTQYIVMDYVNPGDQLFVAYRGQTFYSNMPLQRRLFFFGEYNFLCECNACRSGLVRTVKGYSHYEYIEDFDNIIKERSKTMTPDELYKDFSHKLMFGLDIKVTLFSSLYKLYYDIKNL